MTYPCSSDQKQERGLFLPFHTCVLNYVSDFNHTR